MATSNMDHSTPTAILANRGSDYRMVEMGRMKPYCLQLDASLIEVMDSPPPPAHRWTSGFVADIIRTILPDLNEATIVGDGIAILFFGRRAFGEGLFPQQAGVHCQASKANQMGRPTSFADSHPLITI